MPDQPGGSPRPIAALERARVAAAEAALTTLTPDQRRVVDEAIGAIDRARAALGSDLSPEPANTGTAAGTRWALLDDETTEARRREAAGQAAPAGENAQLDDQNVQLREEVRDAIEARDAERARLQQILDVLPEGILIVDIRGQVIMSSAAARALWGQPIPALDALGRSPAGVWRLDGTPWPPGELPLARSIRDGEIVRGEQMLIACPTTGRRVPVLINSAPLRNTAGTIIGGVAVFQDISAIKDFERQKDEFLAVISHDLRNPLTTIKSLAQLLQRQLVRGIPLEEMRLADRLAAIARTATRASTILAELLDLAHLQMGRSLVLERRLTDLVELTRRVAADHQAVADQHRIVFETTHPSLAGWWDPVRLERVVDNLVSNAVKYSPDGGDVIVALTREEDAGGAWAVLQVRDQGIGIPAPEIDQIFTGFYRGSNVVGGIEGTGIGLAGARQIITQHGGQVSVESQEGSGSTFMVRLPLATSERASE